MTGIQKEKLIHLARGAIGAASIFFAFKFGQHPASFALIVLALAAWKGCPTCWIAGYCSIGSGKSEAQK